jgi:histone H3/H4
MSYVVASKVKEMVNSKGMMSAGDLAEHLSKHIEMWLSMGVKAAQANDRKTVRGPDMLAFAPGKMPLVVASKVKEYINGKGMMSAGDLAEHVSGLAEWLVSKAIERAGANGRKTVRGEDL